jgi:hypothetical protein
MGLARELCGAHMTKHSPEPWSETYLASQGTRTIWDANNYPVAYLARSTILPDRASANAHLIACAPELAKLVKDFADYLNDNGQGSWADDVLAVHAKAGL